MRVITGKAKGHRLKAPKGMGTRPMLDKVKEALFSILEGYGRIRGQVLDLYAGTGSLGIECLSRGAKSADFVEQSAHVCGIIRDNLRHTKLDSDARVHCMAVDRFLNAHRGCRCYDIIVMDPPYADPAIERTIELVVATGMGHDGTLLIVGHASRRPLADQYPGMERITLRRYGDSSFSIYAFREDVTPPTSDAADASSNNDLRPE
ncbi:MAG: 16S rRNA (guanine(966)-N(2))-methyltransferase RsmD [Oscillochloris sp.]|nr:16S rRNA (guanine(966)-N(2))-methyltransferase RsmD [Oscillochloris sp.]